MSLVLLSCLLAAPVIVEDVRLEAGDGTVVEHAYVVIDGGRIRAVGTKAPRLEGTRIQASGKTLTPGLIETQSELGITEISRVPSTRDAEMEIGTLRPGFRVADGFNPSSVLIPIAREHGVTSAITAPDGGIVAGSASWVDLTGTLASRPRPGQPIAMFASVAESTLKSGGGARGGVWLELRQLIADTRFFAGNRAAFARGDARELILSPLHLEAMVPVVNGKLPFVVEAHRASDILAAVELGRSERLDVVILGGAEAWRVASELARTQTPVILTPSRQLPGRFEALAARDDSAALLDQAGVKVIISTGWTHNVRRLRQEAGIAVSHGLGRDAALAAITLRPAEVFGKATTLGSVTVGKRANLVLWSGDPLELQTYAERVWIDGREMSLDTRQKRLVERYLHQR